MAHIQIAKILAETIFSPEKLAGKVDSQYYSCLDVIFMDLGVQGKGHSDSEMDLTE